MKEKFKKTFETFTYFYSHLKYRIFVIILLSIILGVIDGIGLSMFLPLLQMVNDNSAVNSESLGNLGFVVKFLEDIGISLTLLPILLVMIFFFILKGVFQYFVGIYKVIIRNWFIEKIRMENIEDFNGLSYKYFVKTDVGRIQNTLTGEVDKVAQAFQNYFLSLQYGLLVMTYMGFAFLVNTQFAILVSVGGALTNLFYSHLYKKTKGTSIKLTGENNLFQSLIIQNVNNYKYLKATGTINNYQKKLRESIIKIKNDNIRIGYLDAVLNSAREPMLIIIVATVIYIQTAILGSPLGPILISLLFFYRALINLMQMQIRWNLFLSLSGSLKNMVEFSDELKRNQEVSPEAKSENDKSQNFSFIELDDICFSYDKKKILKNISLKINRNETVAFVGESGSGKTTLINIIAGLLPVDRGSYFVNGINSNNLNFKKFQNKIGYITQDPVIFNDTIFNNVTFWDLKNNNTTIKFENSIISSELTPYLNSLEEREDTILSNNGVNLSGGQKQRISIARELYKNSDLLILDEATSSLDSETERSIQKNIDDLKGRYTILIIAHRISTIKNADKIVVMKNGEISAIGDFKNLVKESKYFKKLVELQEV